MNLVGDLEFRTIINNRPVIIKALNTHLLNIEVLSESGFREGVFTICNNDDEETIFTIERIEEEH